ncbi:ABC transporter ATP-binding protein [Desulfoplanes sp. PS50]
MIEFADVCKSFRGHDVFSGLSFRVEENEVVGLLGRSGIGKSTILKMISGLVRHDSGSVRLGSDVLGHIFQEPRLIPWKTALENVSFGMRARGVDRETARQTALEYFRWLDLCGFENHYPGQLSGGMCQRVSIGRAFAVEPRVLLMDEPFSALDFDLRRSMLCLVENMLTRRPATLLYVSHDPQEVSRLAHRILILEEGGVIREAEPVPESVSSNLYSVTTGTTRSRRAM